MKKKIALLFSILIGCFLLLCAVFHDTETFQTQKNQLSQSFALFCLKHRLMNLEKASTFAKIASQPALERAIRFAQNLEALGDKLGLNRKESVELGIYIETSLPKKIEDENYYLSSERSGLPRAIEVIAKNDMVFIHLDNININIIGQGYQKIVTKSIRYDVEHPEIVACCSSSTKIAKEVKFLKKLQGNPGIMKTYAFSSHFDEQTAQKVRTILCKLYRPGSLHKVLNRKSYNFTVKEKMTIARDILQGLKSIHANGIIHKDLGARNYYIDVANPASKDDRQITAVIADFGKSIPIERAMDRDVQANASYVAPEGLNPKELAPTDYYLSDIYATGCVLYQLFYEKKAPWQDKKYVQNIDLPADARKQEFMAAIDQYTKTSRDAFEQKKEAQGLSPIEQFERLILQMVHPDAKKRGSALSLSSEMDQVYSSYTQEKSKVGKI